MAIIKILANSSNIPGDKGPKGDTPYIQGGYWFISGENTGVKAEGDQGIGAYQIAVNEGFEGTESEWIESLKPSSPAFDLDDERVITSTGPDSKLVKSNVLDPVTGDVLTFKEDNNDIPSDGIMTLEHNGKKFSRVVFKINIKSFGAKGDGVTDDTLSITSAVNYLKGIRSYNTSVLGNFNDGLMVLHFPKGIYNYSETIDINFSGINIVGDGVNNSILNYTGTETAIQIGNGTDRARYFQIRDLAVRNINMSAKIGIDLNFANEGILENVWINGSSDGFTEAGIRFTGVGQNRCWTIRLINTRVTNIQGIGYFFSGVTGHNAIFLNDCSAAICNVGLWIETANGAVFTRFQSEGSISGHEVRLGPNSATFSRLLAVTFDTPYIECKAGSDSRCFFLTDLKKDNSTSAVTTINGLGINNVYAWGGNSASHAIEIHTPSRSGLITGHINGGFFHGFQTSVIKSEDSTHRLMFQPVISYDSFGIGDSIPYLENTSARQSGVIITSNESTYKKINKPLAPGSFANNPLTVPDGPGSFWFSTEDKGYRYQNGDRVSKIFENAYYASEPSDAEFKRLIGKWFWNSAKKAAMFWDGNEYLAAGDTIYSRRVNANTTLSKELGREILFVDNIDKNITVTIPNANTYTSKTEKYIQKYDGADFEVNISSESTIANFPTPLKYRGDYIVIAKESHLLWVVIQRGNVHDERALKYGTTSDRPSLVTPGFQYRDTTLNATIIWNGTEWIINHPQASTSPNTATAVPASYDQTWMESFFDEYRDMKAKLIAANLMEDEA